MECQAWNAGKATQNLPTLPVHSKHVVWLGVVDKKVLKSEKKMYVHILSTHGWE
jgi:hypothetical protein